MVMSMGGPVVWKGRSMMVITCGTMQRRIVHVSHISVRADPLAILAAFSAVVLIMTIE